MRSGWPGAGSHTFRNGERVVIEIAENRAADEQRNVRQRLQFRNGARDPVKRRLAVDVGALREQAAAEFTAFVRDDHAGAGTRCRQCGRESGGTAARDEYIAMRVTMLVVIRVVRIRCATHPGSAPDEALVGHPLRRRPHERLVVETRRQQPRQQVIDAADVECDRGPAILARRGKAVIQLDLRRPHVGLGARSGFELHERVGLVCASAHDAARAVILETAADKTDAVCQQCRSEAVPGIAGEPCAVKSEIQRAGAIDQAAAGQAKRLRHLFTAPGTPVATTSCV